MANIKDIIQDLADMAKRGAISEVELKRLLTYLVESNPVPPSIPGDGTPMMETDLAAPIASGQPNGHPFRPQRKFFGRGSYGTVDMERAKDLVLVALMKLGKPATRPQILELISDNWGHEFIAADREVLASNGDERWNKTCQWAIHYLDKEGLIERPRRGLQSLTAKGRLEAQARDKKVNGNGATD